MAAVTPLLSTHHLSRQFGGLVAVDHVNFELLPGEIHAIIGPNGAGKTTLVNLICGRIAPTSGTVFFEGADITQLPAHARVGKGIAYTFQITSIFGNLSCADNVALAAQRALTSKQGRHIRRANRAALSPCVADALARVGLADRSHMQAASLAYGHQRLLEVAMGLALQPKLLILDEPTQGLSDGEIENFCNLIKAVAKKATVLLIEHNMQVVMTLANRITVLHHGATLAEGTPEAIRANEAVQNAYLGS
ncbi:ABC transporter ATP-binding protein [Candidatus Entotheonella serta]|nr:ABC transporter ATP-binding protein [Candidatus Entotheonella serta]